MVEINKVAIIGTGVMGSQIAAHMANCGVDVLLLGSSLDKTSNAIDNLKKVRPPSFFTFDVAGKIKTGSLNDHLPHICDYDWIIESITEDVNLKRDLYSKLDRNITSDLIISSNTSGISTSLLVEGLSDVFKSSFLVTHFFNPVRYMKLVELVECEDTDSDKVQKIDSFLTDIMGKGVVFAKNTPAFIANRIGAYWMMDVVNKSFENGWPIDFVDYVLGKALCFSRSSVFRTIDITGLDALLHVAKVIYNYCPDDPCRDTFVPHKQLVKMIENGMLGVKAGRGFYKKEGADIYVYDSASGKYRPKVKYNYESIAGVAEIDDPFDRVKAVLEKNDAAARIAKEIINDVTGYAGNVAKEIAHQTHDVDRAMKWGYGWSLGPIEMLEDKKRHTRQLNSSNRIASNGSASLVEIEGGMICCEFHSKMNSIDWDIIRMLNKGLDLMNNGSYSGLLIMNNGDDFSVGANLAFIYSLIENSEWNQLEELLRSFQNLNMRIRFSKKPVVAALFGKVLGGGCELCLSMDNVVMAAETYMGLVEFGVGLVPSGGGCKNMILRMEGLQNGGPIPKVSSVFELIGFAKVSASGEDARKMGFVNKDTQIVLDRERLKIKAREYLLKKAGNYHSPIERRDIMLPGRGGEMVLRERLKGLRALGRISKHDVVVASCLARVLCGGNVATVHLSNELDILDMEREAFLKLCGMKKTQERIQHMLATGKPLRN